MDKTLIIKTGATGDVLRTTPLLHAIEGEIHWLTLNYNKTILPPNCDRLTKIFSIEEDIAAIKNESYSKIISLEEEKSICSLITELKFDTLTGIFMKDGIIQYTPDASILFDMSLISLLGKHRADELKFANTMSYQEMIYDMIGKKFTGQKYWMRYQDCKVERTGKKIGIEARAGERWQGKIWNGYQQLAVLLSERGYDVIFFSQKNTLEEYIGDICSCDYIIAGDTLAMHISIAFGLPTIGIFTCTSPNEIYGYNVLQKVITPRLRQSFYKTMPVNESISAISVTEVFEKCLELLTSSSLL